jgi:hypothetical protein
VGLREGRPELSTAKTVRRGSILNLVEALIDRGTQSPSRRIGGVVGCRIETAGGGVSRGKPSRVS